MNKNEITVERCLEAKDLRPHVVLLRRSGIDAEIKMNWKKGPCVAVWGRELDDDTLAALCLRIDPAWGKEGYERDWRNLYDIDNNEVAPEPDPYVIEMVAEPPPKPKPPEETFRPTSETGVVYMWDGKRAIAVTPDELEQMLEEQLAQQHIQRATTGGNGKF